MYNLGLAQNESARSANKHARVGNKPGEGGIQMRIDSRSLPAAIREAPEAVH